MYMDSGTPFQPDESSFEEYFHQTVAFLAEYYWMHEFKMTEYLQHQVWRHIPTEVTLLFTTMIFFTLVNIFVSLTFWLHIWFISELFILELVEYIMRCPDYKLTLYSHKRHSNIYTLIKI